MVQSLLTDAPPSELRRFPLSHDPIPYPTPTPALQEAWVLRDPRGTVQALVSGPAFHSETQGRAGVRPLPRTPIAAARPSPTQGAPKVPTRCLPHPAGLFGATRVCSFASMGAACWVVVWWIVGCMLSGGSSLYAHLLHLLS